MSMPSTQDRENVQEVAGPSPVRAAARNPAMRVGELGLWCFLMIAIGALNLVHVGGPRLWNDSYQYLSIAQNLHSRGAIATSLVYFEAERFHGRIPAPLTTFPPGYPIAIDLVSATFHCSFEQAGLAISFASLLAVVPLLWFASRVLSFPLAVTRMCLFFWVLSSNTSVYAEAITSEGLFTAMILAGILLLAAYEQAGAAKPWQLPAAFGLIGLAYWIRYAGLFLVAASLLYASYRCIRTRKNLSTWLSASALCVFLVASNMLREILITRSWQSGRISGVQNPFRRVFRGLAVIAYKFVIGDGKPHLDAVFLLAAASLSVFLVFLGRALFWGRTPRAEEERRYWTEIAKPLGILVLFALVYCACLIYLGFVSSTLEFGPRYFFPMLPMFILLACTVLAWGWTRISETNPTVRMTVMATFLAGYAASHIMAMSVPVQPAEHVFVADALNAPMDNGQPLRGWIDANIAPQSPILASDAQATGYCLRRATVAFVPREYGRTEWDEDQTRRVMQTFGARYVIVYPGAPPGKADEQSEYPFLTALAKGEHPAWLRLAARSPSAEVFQLQP